MSQYVNFFIRYKDNLLPLADYSRSTSLYHIMNDAPYGKLREYSYKELQFKVGELRTSKAAYLETIDNYNNRITLICEMNDPLADKLDMIASIDETIKDIKQEVEAIDRQAIELDFIAELIYQDYRIYAGIEVEEPLQIEES